MHSEKLPSGSYRYREYLNGRRVSITSKKKLTDAEALMLMTERLNQEPNRNTDRQTMTFEDAHKEYIRLKSSVLSPSTIRGYNSVLRTLPGWFTRKRIYEIEQLDVQKVVNDYTVGHAPKSVSNLYGVISTILATFRPSLNIRCTLPQKRRIEPNIASEDDIKKLSDYFRGTDFEVPFTLGVFGMRRGEIIAVTADDLNGNELTIDKSFVKNDNGEWVQKGTKTTDSTRKIIIPERIADLIREKGYAYNKSPNYINTRLHKAQKALGIEPFTFHKLRHFFASYCHNILKLSDEQIKKMGGWKDGSSVMRQVYAHSMRDEQVKQEVVQGLSGLI